MSLSIKVHLSTSPIVDGSIIWQGSQRETLFADLLEDALSRSSLCHRVLHYQALPDTLNRNYEVCVTSPTLSHHNGGQVEAIVYHHNLDWRLICRWPLLSYSYCRIARNVDTRSLRIVLSLFWGGKGCVLSTLSNWGLKHGYGSMSWIITLWVTLIQFFEDL